MTFPMNTTEVILSSKPTLVRWALLVIGIGAVLYLIGWRFESGIFKIVGIPFALLGVPLLLYRQYLHIDVNRETKRLNTVTQRFFINQRLYYDFDGAFITYGSETIGRSEWGMILHFKTANGYSRFRLVENPMAGLRQYHLEKIIKQIELTGVPVKRVPPKYFSIFQN